MNIENEGHAHRRTTLINLDALPTKLRSAMTRLTRGHPFFTSILFDLDIQIDESKPKAWTDTKTLYIPEWVTEQYSVLEIEGMLGRLILAAANLHGFRRRGRDRFLWNMASHFATNGELLNSGFVLPPNALHDPRFMGQSVEAIYNKLLQEQDPPDTGNDGDCPGESDDDQNDEQDQNNDPNDDGQGDPPDDSDEEDEDEGDGQPGQGDDDSPDDDDSDDDQDDDSGGGEGDHDDPDDNDGSSDDQPGNGDDSDSDDQEDEASDDDSGSQPPPGQPDEWDDNDNSDDDPDDGDAEDSDDDTDGSPSDLGDGDDGDDDEIDIDMPPGSLPGTEEGDDVYTTDWQFGAIEDATEGLGDAESKRLENLMRHRVLKAAMSAQALEGLDTGVAQHVINKTATFMSWKDELRSFLLSTADKSDYSWDRPNRRYIRQDLYLPHLAGREQNDMLVIAVDTSISISEEQLDRFCGSINEILGELDGITLMIIYCDTVIHGEPTIVTKSDLPFTMEAVGRGGTDFTPPFDYLEENDVQPMAMLYFTDLQGSCHAPEPAFPVRWINFAPGSEHYWGHRLPFGEVITMDPPQANGMEAA